MKKIYLTLSLLACIFSARSFAQCSTPSVVPYYEDFNSITATNQLPACWAISNASTCLTTTLASGNHFAVFVDSPLGSNYFYSRAIQLTAGVTYSTSAWYKVSSSASNNWSDFSILVGTSQSTTGLVQIASTNGPASNIVYGAISNTFVVATSGVYYFAIRGISVNGSSFPSLQWDDFSVILPCSAGSNAPVLSITQSTTSLCSGNLFTATVTGASTYSWSTGSTASNFTDTPTQNVTYNVLGTNTLSGCSTTMNATYVNVMPLPVVLIIPDKPTVCLGESMVLQSNTTPSVLWSNGATSVNITVTPTATTIYSVVGTNANGCSSSASYTATVVPVPVFTYSSSSGNVACKGDGVTLSASNSSLTYIWSTSQGNYSGANINFVANLSGTINVTGTASDGCKKTSSFVLTVDNCTGLTQNSSSSTLKVYPNPGNGIYILESKNADLKSVVITDVNGKIIFTTDTTNDKLKIDLQDVAAGIYFAKVNSAGKTETLKLIKE